MQDFKLNKKMIVLLPADIDLSVLPCKLYGYYKKEAGVFNVIGTVRKPGLRYLGSVVSNDSEQNPNELIGRICGGDLKFSYKGEEYSIEKYDLCMNVFSRNTGILETSKMLKKSAVILGCGSVGSLVALELARSGVGSFLLVDTDVVEYHNVCRHQCGIHEIGEYKVDAVKKRILDINPTARVITRTAKVQNVSQKDFEKVCRGTDTVFVGCADNRQADIYSNMVAARMESSFISIGFWERALAGEIFYWLPQKNMPCYGCALGAGTGRVSENNHHIYSNEIDLAKLKFEPGISADINFITDIGIKLIIDILNSNEKGYRPRLLNNLKQYTLACNTSDPKIGGEMVEIFSYPLQVTTSLKVDFGPQCREKCKCRYE